jgi:hypothetical protein
MSTKLERESCDLPNLVLTHSDYAMSMYRCSQCRYLFVLPLQFPWPDGQKLKVALERLCVQFQTHVRDAHGEEKRPSPRYLR